MARRQRHLPDFARIPGRNNQSTAIRISPDIIGHFEDLINRIAVGCSPVTPLCTIDAPQIAIFVGPFVPDRDPVFIEKLDVGLTPQEPKKLENNRPKMHAFGRRNGETKRETNRAFAPKKERGPTPVRFSFGLPFSRTRRSKSWYWFTAYGSWFTVHHERS